MNIGKLVLDFDSVEDISNKGNEAQKTILLVENEFLIAMTNSAKLKEFGYNIIHVLNGQKAIDTVTNRKNKIDLILMDINLGEILDGTDIARIILKDHNIPLLFFTSQTESEVVQKTENIIFYGYVIKNSDYAFLDASIKLAFRLHGAYKNLGQFQNSY